MPLIFHLGLAFNFEEKYINWLEFWQPSISYKSCNRPGLKALCAVSPGVSPETIIMKHFNWRYHSKKLVRLSKGWYFISNRETLFSVGINDIPVNARNTWLRRNSREVVCGRVMAAFMSYLSSSLKDRHHHQVPPREVAFKFLRREQSWRKTFN